MATHWGRRLRSAPASPTSITTWPTWHDGIIPNLLVMLGRRSGAFYLRPDSTIAVYLNLPLTISRDLVRHAAVSVSTSIANPSSLRTFIEAASRSASMQWLPRNDTSHRPKGTPIHQLDLPKTRCQQTFLISSLPWGATGLHYARASFLHSR